MLNEFILLAKATEHVAGFFKNLKPNALSTTTGSYDPGNAKNACKRMFRTDPTGQLMERNTLLH